MLPLTKNKVLGLLLAAIAGLVYPSASWAAHGGGGHGGGGFGGGFHGGGGGFHGSASGFHGGSSRFSGMTSVPSQSFSGMSRANSFNSARFHSSNSFHGNALGNSAFRGTNHFALGVNPGHFIAGAHDHPVNPQAWHHDANWGDAGRNWDHRVGDFYHRDFDDFHHHYYHHYYPYFGLGLWNPIWWSWGPYYGDYGYGNYYPYTDYYYGSEYRYAPTTYVSSPNVTGDTVNFDQTPNDQAPLTTAETAVTGGETNWGTQYLDAARDAFRQGSYSDAMRLASHAAIEMPKDAKTHELLSLAAFAMKDYRGANLEAHAALSLGSVADWPTLYAYYGDLPTYTKQIDALVDYLHQHQDAADARFVLAYHNLMMGHKDAAKEQFAKVLEKIPQDKIAGDLLKNLGGIPPEVKGPSPTVPATAVPTPPSNEKPKTEEQPNTTNSKSF